MKFILSLLLVAGAAAAHAHPLWTKANSGMSVEDVQASFPNGVITPPGTGSLYSGAILKYRVENVDVQGSPFQVNFYFNADGLEQVALSSRTKEDTMLCTSRYTQLHSALSGKYGTPVNIRKFEPDFGQKESTFSQGDLAIVTSVYPLSRGCSIDINYKSNKTGASSNL